MSHEPPNRQDPTSADARDEAAGKPKPFDLIELTDSVDGFQPGSRGTLVVQGIGQALVDFSWCDGGQKPGDGDRLQRVPEQSMKVIRSRLWDEAVAARSAGMEDAPPPATEAGKG